MSSVVSPSTCLWLLLRSLQPCFLVVSCSGWLTFGCCRKYSKVHVFYPIFHSLLTSTDSCFCPFVFHFFCCAFSISEAYCFQFSAPTLWHLLWSYTLTTLPFCLYLFQSLDTVDWQQPTSFATLCAELPFSKEFSKPLPLFQLTAFSLEPCFLPISLMQLLIKVCSFFSTRLICLFILVLF